MKTYCPGQFFTQKILAVTYRKVSEISLKLVFFSFVCLFSTVAIGAFPSQYYPDKDHPRLWLNAERLAVFETAKLDNTQRWLEYKALCDSLVDTDPSNDPWNIDEAPQHYTAPLALMYILTGDTCYADRCLELMDVTSTDFSGYAEPDHESYQYLGLAYDWLHDYAGMTEDRKIAYRTKMKTISDQFWNDNNLHASGTDSDKNLLTMTIHFMLGAAMYGDNTHDAVTLLDRAWTGWDRGYYITSGTSNRDLIKSALGGAYFTGFDYFNATDSRGIAGFWLGMETACGYDIDTVEPELKQIWPNIVRSVLHLTEPGREKIYHYGSWQDPNTLADQSWMHRALLMIAYFAKQAGYSQEASLARGFASNVDVGYHGADFEEFFFDMPSASVTNPYEANLPLVRFADEPDFLLFRDNWSISANWGIFIGNGSIPFDHQAPDHGSFIIWRSNDYLTKGARSYGSMMNGDFYNTLSIENGCEVNGEDCSGTAIFNSERKASISRHREGDGSLLFAYGMLEADGQWNENPEEWEPVANVSTYRRHFFWADPYVVVFDRLRTKTNGWVKYRLRAMTEPVISGNMVSQLSANGEHKLLQRTLEPVGAIILKIDESVLWSGIEDWLVNASERMWQSVIDIPSTTAVNILNVMQAGPSSMSDFDTMEHLTGNGNSGVRIGNWIILFSSEENLRTTVNYDVSNGFSGMWHLIGDLEAGQYEVSINGQIKSVVTVENGDNTALFQLDGLSSPMFSVSLQPHLYETVYVNATGNCGTGREPCYATIQQVLELTGNPFFQVKIAQGYYYENLTAANDCYYKLSGGYDHDFSLQPGQSTIYGNLIIMKGTLKTENLVLKAKEVNQVQKVISAHKDLRPNRVLPEQQVLK